ncbi:unnamed protein product, partial [Staurois parvus]
QFITYNVNGLSCPGKRFRLFNELHHRATSVVFLQETHFEIEVNVKLKSKHYPTWYYADSPIKRAKGVAIGFAKNMRFELEDRRIDPEGRFLFLKGRLQGIECTLANIYCPNKNPEMYMKGLLKKLMEFKTGRLIVAGDLNFCMDPQKDNTSSVQREGSRSLRALKKVMHEYQLVDTWRIKHMKDRDYTFFSNAHEIYSRLDYILIDHQLIDHLVKIDIETRTFSDHAPVVMKMGWGRRWTGGLGWRLNEGLLLDEDVVQKIEKEIKIYFKENETKEVSIATVWESHKVFIRGILIVAGARKKKERRERVSGLLKEILDLEQIHKKKITKDTRQSVIG